MDFLIASSSDKYPRRDVKVGIFITPDPINNIDCGNRDIAIAAKKQMDVKHEIQNLSPRLGVLVDKVRH